MKPIFDHISMYLPFGSEVVSMLQSSPDSYGALVKEIEEKFNLDEMTEFMATLNESTKVIPLADAEPLRGPKYSGIFEEAGATALAEAMAKFEVYSNMQFRKNQQFLNDELIPYLQSLYKANQAKFNASMGGSNSPEDQIMMMLSARFDWFATQVKAKLEKKKLGKINALRRNPEISTLLAALA